jgi:signal transduction histidine kinase
MSVRRFTGFLILFLVATAVVAIGLTQGPALLSGQSLWIIVAFSAGVSFFVLFLYILADQVLLRDPRRVLQDPMQVALEFNRRTLGLSDEGTLAGAIGSMLAEWLNVHRSGWLLFKPRDNGLSAKPVAGKGNLPETPLELSRNNWLLQELSQRRAPVLHTELEDSNMPEVEREWFGQLGISVYAPIFEAGILTAVLAVGPKEGGRRPAREELDLLSLIAALATPALKSARSLTEIRQLNETIAQQTEKLEARSLSVSQSDTAHSEFLAITSHELRTPITQLLGYADLMGTMVRENTLDRVTAAQVTESIVRACGRLNEVISQMLDMAQIDANALELKLSTTTLDHILRQALEPYLPAVRERKQTLNVTGLKALPSLVGDEQRLAQAFSQLASNAIKYTPDGGRIDVTVRVLPQDEKQPARLLITFADTGIGIDPRQHRLIFEKFYRVGSSSQHSTSMTKFMGAGPGLGLPIAKGVIERHGGRIWVESAGHDAARFPGSRFHVVLPFRPPGLDSNAVLASAEDIARLRRTGRLG